VTEIIQHVEYSVPMARVAEIAQNATAHWGNPLQSRVTLSSADISASTFKFGISIWESRNFHKLNIKFP
jgi:hypothetical protein